MFSQTFATHDLFVVLVLVLLEGVLSIDNALVLGVLARRLPKEQRSKALSYGLIGAMVFRISAIFLASLLLRTKWLQVVGGLYLLYLPIKHFLSHPPADEGKGAFPVVQSNSTADKSAEVSNAESPQEEVSDLGIAVPVSPAEITESTPAKSHENSAVPGRTYAKFWPTVVVIELTDIAFAVDSVLAAVAMVVTDHGPMEGKIHPKMWVIIAGGLAGVVLVRFAARLFIGLLDRFPRFETSAYLLVLVVGIKLMIDAYFNAPGQPHRIDFSSPKSPAFWTMWGIMAICFAVGFIPRKKKMQGENFID